MIRVYTYNISSKVFHKEKVGHIDSIMKSLELENSDFTLVKPPSLYELWKWDGSQWVKAEIEQPQES